MEYDVKNRVDVDKKLQEFDNRLKELERSNKPAGPKVAGNQ